MTTVSGQGHPEPRVRHRRGSRLGFLQLRATLAELRRWRRRATRYGLTLSEFVRSVMNREPIRVVSVADPALLGELRRQGNNLNQLVHAIHNGFPVAAARVEDVLAVLHALYRKEIERG